MLLTIKKILNKIIVIYYYASNNCFSKSEDMRNRVYDKKIYIYTAAWGEYLDWYFKYSLPSLTNKTNSELLIGAGYKVKFILYTTDSKKSVVKKYMSKNNGFSAVEIVEFDSGNENEVRKIAVKPLVDILKRCLKEKAMLFQAPPDIIFSNGSLYNSVITSFGKNKCFASAISRVSVDILNDIPAYLEKGIKGSKLVGICMKYMHDELRYANEDLEKNTTYKGISYRKISSSMYTITHNLPSVFLVFPIKDDYEYFNKVQDFNMWDRGWLEILVRTKRLKISGSSDLFFPVELTNDNFDRNSEISSNLKYNDELYRPEIHNHVANMFITVWRSDV